MRAVAVLFAASLALGAPKRKPETAWKHDEGAAIATAPVRADDRIVYGVGANRVVCRDAKTGREMWTAEADSLADPTVFDGSVWFEGTRGLRLVDGEAVNALDEPHYSTTRDGFILSFEGGRERWRAEFDAALFAARGKFVLAVNDLGVAVALDARTGKERWRREGKRPAGTPRLGKDTCLLAEEGALVEVRLGDGADLRRVADGGLSTGASVHGDLAVYGTKDGHVVVLDDGLRELARVAVGAPAVSSVQLKGRVVVGVAGKRLFAVDARAGALQWVYDAPAPLTRPLVAGRVIYVGAGDVFYCLR